MKRERERRIFKFILALTCRREKTILDRQRWPTTVADSALHFFLVRRAPSANINLKPSHVSPEINFTIAIYSSTQTAEVLKYEDCFGYRRVYSEDGLSVSPSHKKEVNSFLNQWLAKRSTQGHRPA